MNSFAFVIQISTFFRALETRNGKWQEKNVAARIASRQRGSHDLSVERLLGGYERYRLHYDYDDYI